MMTNLRVAGLLAAAAFTAASTGAADAAIYKFSQTWDSGAVLSGRFSAEDLDGDGFVRFNDWDPGVANEVFGFSAHYSGAGLVPALDFEDRGSLGGLSYALDGDALGDDAGEGLFIGDPGGQFQIALGLAFLGAGHECDGVSGCGVLVGSPAPGALDALSAPLIVTAVPLPPGAALLSAALAGFGLLRRPGQAGGGQSLLCISSSRLAVRSNSNAPAPA